MNKLELKEEFTFLDKLAEVRLEAINPEKAMLIELRQVLAYKQALISKL